MSKLAAMAFAALAFAAAAQAQHQPYGGQQERDIKALSEEEVNQYLSGAAALQGNTAFPTWETHCRLRPLLTDEQVARYDNLRGYASQSGQPVHKH
jgi:hypothetical protein